MQAVASEYPHSTLNGITTCRSHMRPTCSRSEEPVCVPLLIVTPSAPPVLSKLNILHTHTHTPPTHPGYPMVDSPYPCSCGPILNMFSNYLQSPGHNRKPWASKVGGVAMFCLLIYMCVSSFAGYYKLTNASNVIACNQEPYREPPNTGCQVNILTLQGKSRIQNAQLYTCDAQLWCTLITNSLHPGTICLQFLTTQIEDAFQMQYGPD